MREWWKKYFSPLLCFTVSQFPTYVNFSACTPIFSVWIVIVNSFRKWHSVLFSFVLVLIVSAHQCCCGFFSWDRRWQNLVTPFLFVWFPSVTLSSSIYIPYFATSILIRLWGGAFCLGLISLLLPWLYYRSFSSLTFLCVANHLFLLSSSFSTICFLPVSFLSVLMVLG